jgi:hypothetical protein
VAILISATVDRESFNPNAKIPFDLSSNAIGAAIKDLYDILFVVNAALIAKSYSVLEELMLGNAFSGFLGEILVKQLSVHSKQVVRNTRVGGHPDLVPRGKYKDDCVLKGDEGVEIKVSRQKGGWQGHNIEEGWLMVFVYSVGDKSRPTEITAVFSAELTRADWSFSGRSETSRRTITASVRNDAVRRMKDNWIYRKKQL